MNKIIIHVDGVPGSGKSYLCTKLKNVPCVDTDDIVKLAFKKADILGIRETKANIDKLVEQIINKLINKNNFIVFSGMTASIPNPSYKFFIKIEDLVETYKRLNLRELDKIIRNYDNIKKSIHSMTAGKNLIFRNANLTWCFPLPYDNFVEDYEKRLKQAKEEGYTILSKEDIYKFINNLKNSFYI